MQGFQQLQEDWKGPSWGRSQEGRPGETQNASLWALMSVGDMDSELNQPNERNEEEPMPPSSTNGMCRGLAVGEE